MEFETTRKIQNYCLKSFLNLSLAVPVKSHVMLYCRHDYSQLFSVHMRTKKKPQTSTEQRTVVSNKIQKCMSCFFIYFCKTHSIFPLPLAIKKRLQENKQKLYKCIHFILVFTRIAHNWNPSIGASCCWKTNCCWLSSTWGAILESSSSTPK